MGNGGLCGVQGDYSELKLYGDYFNADTRTALNILMICGITPKFIQIDSLQDASSEQRRKYRKNENPADCFPMLVHGKFKIMSNIEHIMKYIENTFPQVKETLFDCIQGDNFKRLVRWN
mmetsp:Transcript_6064/g.9771  ORF Transcript_6064/g.9771 Transcript_6064/m.9771 type:complete len:119 (+) Transcript_6064:39-395(+)